MHQEIPTEESFKLLQQSLPDKHIIILKFTADWCGPCQKIKGLCEIIVKTLPEAVKFYEIDVDKSLDLYIKLKKYKMLNGVPAFLGYTDGQSDFWYVPDFVQLGSNEKDVIAFFDKCINYVKS